MKWITVALNVKLFLCAIGITIHAIAILILTKMKKRRNSSDQARILINYSVSILLTLLAFTVGTVSGLFMFEEEPYNKVDSYAEYLGFTLPRYLLKGIQFCFHMGASEVSVSMILLTVDRLIHTVLPQR